MALGPILPFFKLLAVNSLSVSWIQEYCGQNPRASMTLEGDMCRLNGKEFAKAKKAISPSTRRLLEPGTTTVPISNLKPTSGPREIPSAYGTHTASTLKGQFINKFMMNGTYPLIQGGDAANYSAGPETLQGCDWIWSSPSEWCWDWLTQSSCLCRRWTASLNLRNENPNLVHENGRNNLSDHKQHTIASNHKVMNFTGFAKDKLSTPR